LPRGQRKRVIFFSFFPGASLLGYLQRFGIAHSRKHVEQHCSLFLRPSLRFRDGLLFPGKVQCVPPILANSCGLDFHRTTHLESPPLPHPASMTPLVDTPSFPNRAGQHWKVRRVFFRASVVLFISERSVANSEVHRALAPLLVEVPRFSCSFSPLEAVSAFFNLSVTCSTCALVS